MECYWECSVSSDKNSLFLRYIMRGSNEERALSVVETIFELE